MNYKNAKLFYVLVLSFPLLIFGKEDTLYKKRLNISVGFDLSIPQQRSYVNITTKTYPNGLPATVSQPVFSTGTTQNAWNVYLGIDVKLRKKLKLQTGFYLTSTAQKSYAFRDTFGTYKNVYANTSQLTITNYYFTMPIGLQYVFNKNISLNIGANINIHNISTEKDAFYNGSVQVTPLEKRTYSYNFQYSDYPFLIKYIGVNFHLLPRTYLSLKASCGKLNCNEFRGNLYYSIGFKFLIMNSAS